MNRFLHSSGFISLCFLVCFSTIHGQREVLSSGGDAQGGSGAFSWSLGQVAVLHYSGPDGYISEGVQQPAELFLTGADVVEVHTLKLYPNPGTNNIHLKGLEHISLPTQYSILNSVGQELQTGELSLQQPSISVLNLSAGAYTLLLPYTNLNTKIPFVKH